MKTLYFVESVQFSRISLAEKLYVTFDNMKGISRPSFCFIKNKSFEQDSCSPGAPNDNFRKISVRKTI